MKDLESKVCKSFARHEISLQGKRVLVALSGGVDSVSLLHLCKKKLEPQYRCTFFAAHVDHGLREDSGRDSQFVKGLCANLGVKLFTTKLQGGLRQAKGSPENWARDKRYLYFKDLSQKHSFDYVFTAHHLNDQLETLYMRIDRQAGLKGLRGIHYMRQPNILRPMLSVSKKMIYAYAQDEELPWREDITNTHVQFQRNLIREKMASGKLASQPSDLHSAEIICQAAADIWKQIQASIKGYLIQGEDGSLSLARKDFDEILAWGPDLSYEVFSTMAEYKGLQLRRSFFREFEIQREKHPENIKIQLNNKYQLILNPDFIHLTVNSTNNHLNTAKNANIYIELESELTEFKGEWRGRQIELKAWRYPKSPGFHPIINGGNRVTLDGGLFSSKLIIRKRNIGDKFSPLGSGSSNKKLKKYFIDKKFSNLQKENQILVCSHDTIAWLPNVEISDTFKVTSRTSEILEIEIKC